MSEMDENYLKEVNMDELTKKCLENDYSGFTWTNISIYSCLTVLI